MKKLVYILPVALLCLTASCKKSKKFDNVKSVQLNNNLDSNVSLSATIAGTPWSTDSVFGYFVKNSANDSFAHNLMITATGQQGGSSMILTVYNYKGIGSYQVNPPYSTITYYEGNDRHFATRGSIVITKDSGYVIQGQFNSFDGVINITDGVFDVVHP